MSTDLKDKNITNSSEDLYTYKPRERFGKTQKKKTPDKQNNNEKKSIAKFIIIPLVIIVLLIFSCIGYSMTLPGDKVADNVYVNSIDVGKMTQEEVMSAVSDIIADDAVINITSSGHDTSINASDFELSVDAEKTAQNAMSVGKSKNPFINAYYAVKLLFTDHVVSLVPKYDEKLLDEILFAFGTTINGVSTEPKFEFTSDSITLIPGTAGQNPDTSLARNQVIDAISSGQFDDIEVFLDYAEPLKLDANKIYKEISQPAQDASYEVSEDGKITVNKHTVNVEVDKSLLVNAINTVNAGKEITLNAKVSLPTKTKEDLEKNLFSTTLGTFSSDFSSSSANRAHNVIRAASSINGKILMPGEEFSYNGAIGNPSAKNGYKMASVFQNGKTAQGVGGGVCQVSSTLYNAVLYADLSVTERHNHSLPVGYVPNGQDATVSYGSLDFKFKNNTDYPIKITTTSQNRRLVVSIIGGAYTPERKVTISNSTVSTIAPGEHITEDPTLPAGTRIVTSSGKNGYIVDTYKTVFENGVKISSKKITRSVYKATDAEVTVGVVTEGNIPPDGNTDIDSPDIINPEDPESSDQNDSPSVETINPQPSENSDKQQNQTNSESNVSQLQTTSRPDIVTN